MGVANEDEVDLVSCAGVGADIGAGKECDVGGYDDVDGNDVVEVVGAANGGCCGNACIEGCPVE